MQRHRPARWIKITFYLLPKRNTPQQHTHRMKGLKAILFQQKGKAGIAIPVSDKQLHKI